MNYIQSEFELENQMIKTMIDLGYSKVNIPDEKSLLSNLRIQIDTHNLKKHLNNKPLSNQEFDRLLIQLGGKGIFQSAYNLRQLQTIERDDGSTVYIELINQKDWCKNEFQVTNQITVDARRVNRYDVTILINGLPLVQIELKKRGKQMKEAFNQINRYKSESYTGLFKYIQLFVVSNGINTKYVSNDETKLNFGFAFHWTDSDNNRINNLSDFTKAFLNPCQIAKLISRYMVLNQTDKKLMVMRPYQIYAVEKLVERASETRNNGYVWHATGSGKTLTSFKLSQILSQFEDIQKVIFLVDRKDLDAQTLSEFNKFQPDSVDMTSSTFKLIKQFEDTSQRLIITTIQKMNNAIKNPRYTHSMELYKDQRVIFIIDECHRSQFGEMHKEIRKHFNHAQYFGFTGTPIFEENSGRGLATGNLFGKQVHNYLIKDGINDQNILAFKVDYIKTFKINHLATDDDVEAIDTQEVIESPTRIENIVHKILEIHSKKTSQKEFNSIFATSGIKMAMNYYEAFKTKNHDLVITTIFTYQPNEETQEEDRLSRDLLEGAIKDYNQHFKTNFTTDTYSGYFTDMSKRFKNKEIDIMIVVDMFLTGFDSKWLNTLYIDKKLKMHNLIQAFSRTNRIHTERKQFGNIVSFMTRRQDVEEAIYVYSDSSNTDTVLLKPYHEYLDRVRREITTLKNIVPTVQHVDRLEGETMQKDFIEAFKALVKTITTLKNFIEFQFTFDEVGMSEQEYMDYRSKYLDLNRMVAQLEKESILGDISFDLELLVTDTIDVDYILNLLKSVNYDNAIQKQVDLERVRKVLDQNDTDSLHSKIELIRKFMDKVAPELSNEDDIEMRYEAFVDEEKEKAVLKVAETNNVPYQAVKTMISDYQFSNVMPNHLIREHVKGNFLEKRKRMDSIRSFLVDVIETY